MFVACRRGLKDLPRGRVREMGSCIYDIEGNHSVD